MKKKMKETEANYFTSLFCVLSYLRPHVVVGVVLGCNWNTLVAI